MCAYQLCQKDRRYPTYTVALCILGKAHRTVRFGVTPERALGIHTLKAKPTVMAPLLTLVDICERG